MRIVMRFYRYTYKYVDTAEGYCLKKVKEPVRYTYESMEAFMDLLRDNGYELVQTDEGTLGIGNWYCIPPEKGDWIYIINEMYINCWSSTQTIRRVRKLTSSEQEELETVGYEMAM